MPDAKHMVLNVDPKTQKISIKVLKPLTLKENYISYKLPQVVYCG